MIMHYAHSNIITHCDVTVDVPSNAITHCHVTVGVCSNIITHRDVIISHDVAICTNW